MMLANEPGLPRGAAQSSTISDPKKALAVIWPRSKRMRAYDGVVGVATLCLERDAAQTCARRNAPAPSGRVVGILGVMTEPVN